MSYKDKNLSINERVEDLLKLMTLEEKVGQMQQISMNQVTMEEAEEWAKKGVGSFLHCLEDSATHLQDVARSSTRLGIPMLFGIDAIHGHALHNGATIFPSQLGASCSWNTELIREMGKVTAREVSADGLHWAFSPVLCIGRDLRWGRIDETFGEDSYLIGELGAAIIDGYQCEHKMIACAKHYLGYGESTGGRDSYDTEVSYRKIKEVFFPPFKRASEAGCGSMMTGYGSISGVPMTANKKVLRNLLKDESGYDGFIVTDWYNVDSLMYNQRVAKDIDEATEISIEAGNDMSMNSFGFYEAAIRLVKSGKLDEKLVDDAARRILRAKFYLGLFDDCEKTDKSVIACDEHIEINKELTRESLVLLENKNNTLPLSSDVKKIAVIGPNADDLHAQFGDWTYFSHPDPNEDAVPLGEYYTVYQGIKKVFSSCEVVYHKGCDIMDASDKQIDEAVKAAEQSDAIVVVLGDCLRQNGEYKDRADLTLSGAQLELLDALKATGKKLIGVLVNGKPLCINPMKEKCDALIESFNSGTHGGLAIAELLHGDFNPSGKLTISFPNIPGETVMYYNQFTGWHGGRYMDGGDKPAYCFGYGKSFTEYKYSNIRLSKQTCSAEDTITVSVDVTNTGKIDGKETVQLYVRDMFSSMMTPALQLRGFKKVFIAAGETVTVDIEISVPDALSLITPDCERVVEPGEFEIMVGASSSKDELLTATLTVE